MGCRGSGNRLGLGANIRQYEIGRTMPLPAVQSFLKVIAAEPERTAATLTAA